MSRTAGDGEPESTGLGALSSPVAQERLPAWRRSWLGPGNLPYVRGWRVVAAWPQGWPWPEAELLAACSLVYVDACRG